MHTTHIRQSTAREVRPLRPGRRGRGRGWKQRGPASPGAQQRCPTCHASGSSEGPARGACV